MIRFSGLEDGFAFSNPEYFRDWLNNVIHSENKTPGDIQFIFCDDDYLLNINKKYLNHDFFTDIITFPTSVDQSTISADIYISYERLIENAKNQGVSFRNELSRVLVHGVLHLIGYNDDSDDDKQQMRNKEDYYLNLQP